MVRAWRRATVSGTELRLVVTDQNVSRVLGLRGLDRRVPAYPSLEAATAARLPAAAVLAAATPRPAGQRPNGNGAAGLPGGLLEPLQDAVALADGDGMITAASREHLRLLDAVVTGLFHAGWTQAALASARPRNTCA